jgi:hypothetical protein
MSLPSSLPWQESTCSHNLRIIPSSHDIMLHMSSPYCQKLMFSNSLIFSMGAISMKVNSTFVFILVITTPIVIYTLVHSYLVIKSDLSDLNLDSYHGHHTFFLRCLHPLSWGGCILLHLGCLKMNLRFSTIICIIWKITAIFYIKKLRDTPSNPLFWFLCYKLLHLLSSYLHLFTRDAWQLHPRLHK